MTAQQTLDLTLKLTKAAANKTEVTITSEEAVYLVGVLEVAGYPIGKPAQEEN